ncbi:uncharacterized protein K452DRAFT_250405, partial [Aplosporella prunicola CBS 121167]
MPYFAFTATRVQVATYLLAVALFSISFLVFLNSSLSFVITERIGRSHDVGDAVGTLGFADELVALVACPAWGMVSDRIGVAKVATVGYAIVALSLLLFVQATNVYPQLLLGRLLFAVGASATTTMVTAVLPAMTHVASSNPLTSGANASRHATAPSISSELTITPTRFRSSSPEPVARASAASTSNLAGLVGMFTGFGALLALAVFLPLPTRFQKSGAAPSVAVANAYYVVAMVALVVAIVCMFGLRGLPGEESKGWRNLFHVKTSDLTASVIHPTLSYPRLLANALKLGFQDINVGLGYLGGFVARASSVAISLFIPLFANAYFINRGLCRPGDDKSNEDIKNACRRAYVLAAILTGTSQLIALICAPVFGYLSGRYSKYNEPLILASVAGIAGYIAFGLLKSPDPSSDDGSVGVFFIVVLLGISQIGAIVCSLGLLGRGIQGSETESGDGYLDAERTPTAGTPSVATASLRDPMQEPQATESSPLLPSHFRQPPSSTDPSSRSHLKGSIAGVYSLAGGAGILILTKVGGVMFDRLDAGAPFFLMAGFNSLLLLAAV